MALKLNIRPEVEEEMDDLLEKSGARSKTEYINRAIETYNEILKRTSEVEKLRSYFRSYQKEGKAILDAFGNIRRNND